MKILIISHNPVSAHNAMGKTIASFFKTFEKSEICQIYIYPTFPDVDLCNSYYRITDIEIIKSIFSPEKPGKEILYTSRYDQIKIFENPEDEKIYKSKYSKKPIAAIARDFLWVFSTWKNKGLDEWLEKEKPDCIFAAPGQAKFLYNIALYISQKTGIPIVTYIFDEYYFLKETGNAIEILQKKLLKNKIQQLLHNSQRIVCISEELKKAYKEKFDIPIETVMTGSKAEKVDSCVKKNMSISYFGNIGYNRFLSIKDIGNCLDEINAESGNAFKLNLFTSENREYILKEFKGIKSINMAGFVTGPDYEREFRSSYLLLHTEAFDKENTELVKHSVSTKIPDILASGIPLLAYGPKDISSMRHLIRNDCAYIATSPHQLKDVVHRALMGEKSERIIANALKTAQQYHNSEKNSRKLREIFENVTSAGQ